MKFTIPSSVLSEHLSTLNRTIGQKNTMPILDDFLFIVKDGRITVVASDTENRITASLPLNECEGELTFAVNAKTLMGAINALPDQPLYIEVNEGNMAVTIKYQNGKYNMMGERAEDYPSATPLDGEIKDFSIPSIQLSQGISRAIKASADDMLRPQLGCVYFDFRDNELSLVSSDGNRMAVSTLAQNGENNGVNFLLPKKAALLVRGISLKTATDTKVRFSRTVAEFTIGNYTLTARLLESRFPNYKSVIPINNDKKVVFDRQALLSVIKRVMVFSSESALIKLDLSDGVMNISAQDIDFNRSASEAFKCDYSSEPITIGFKATSLVEMLDSISTKEAEIYLADSSRAGIIKPTENEEGSQITLLLMPMVLNA